MAHESKQTDPEDITSKMRRSFSWDKAFFTSDGLLDDEELSSMIKGCTGNLKNQLQKIEQLESMETKLFEESNRKSSEASKLTNSSIKVSSGKSKKVTGAGGPRMAAPTKTQPARSSTKRIIRSKTGKATTGDSFSKTPPGISTKNKMLPYNTRLPATSPSSPISPGSPGSSSSTSAISRRSSMGSIVPRRSSVNNEISSATKNPRIKNDQKTGKPIGVLMPKIIPSINLKNKPPPVNSHPSSPLGRSELSSTTFTVNQKSISSASKGTRVAKLNAALHSQTGSISRPSSEGKPCKSPLLDGLPKVGQHSKPGSPNSAQVKKVPSPKTIADDKGLKLNSRKATGPRSSKKQSSSDGSKGAKNIPLISPEILDIKGKLKALKMEISMQKKDRCKTNKGESTSNGVLQMNKQTKLT
ncbi:hypothetical protein CTI12_AA318290 [Artemisia annua]|uniref:Uncharacterized protein n=1 Tax=Artemisia annua TaxID=35608 RepID=A0A2U1N1Y9_ARTAN|nr:hypothetical protein CTI12_AA318290 [Artemisia annua]